eukprot:gb/GEZN01000107.1/.p1 GENE.gb/GEZN01000107.1/~~gb/GEZN01000107.1/.p1  ORF type:complete len:2169 (-),score=239.56 gb/GEZN01000107.1/:461-6967(-)
MSSRASPGWDSALKDDASFEHERLAVYANARFDGSRPFVTWFTDQQVALKALGLFIYYELSWDELVLRKRRANTEFFIETARRNKQLQEVSRTSRTTRPSSRKTYGFKEDPEGSDVEETVTLKPKVTSSGSLFYSTSSASESSSSSSFSSSSSSSSSSTPSVPVVRSVPRPPAAPRSVTSGPPPRQRTGLYTYEDIPEEELLPLMSHEYQELALKTDRAFYYIHGKLVGPAKRVVLDLARREEQDPKALYDRLSIEYGATNVHRPKRLLTDLNDFQFRAKGSISDQFIAFRLLVDELEALGCPIGDPLAINFFRKPLSALPGWRSFLDAMTIMENDATPWTLSDYINKAMTTAAEMKDSRKDQTKPSTDPPATDKQFAKSYKAWLQDQRKNEQKTDKDKPAKPDKTTPPGTRRPYELKCFNCQKEHRLNKCTEQCKTHSSDSSYDGHLGNACQTLLDKVKQFRPKFPNRRRHHNKVAKVIGSVPVIPPPVSPAQPIVPSALVTVSFGGDLTPLPTASYTMRSGCSSKVKRPVAKPKRAQSDKSKEAKLKKQEHGFDRLSTGLPVVVPPLSAVALSSPVAADGFVDPEEVARLSIKDVSELEPGLDPLLSSVKSSPSSCFSPSFSQKREEDPVQPSIATPPPVLAQDSIAPSSSSLFATSPDRAPSSPEVKSSPSLSCFSPSFSQKREADPVQPSIASSPPVLAQNSIAPSSFTTYVAQDPSLPPSNKPRLPIILMNSCEIHDVFYHAPVGEQQNIISAYNLYVWPVDWKGLSLSCFECIDRTKPGAKPPFNRQCELCSEQSVNMLKCGGCVSVFYCNRRCQRLDRPAHAEFCKYVQSRPAIKAVFAQYQFPHRGIGDGPNSQIIKDVLYQRLLRFRTGRPHAPQYLDLPTEAVQPGRVSNMSLRHVSGPPGPYGEPTPTGEPDTGEKSFGQHSVSFVPPPAAVFLDSGGTENFSGPDAADLRIVAIEKGPIKEVATAGATAPLVLPYHGNAAMSFRKGSGAPWHNTYASSVNPYLDAYYMSLSYLQVRGINFVFQPRDDGTHGALLTDMTFDIPPERVLATVSMVNGMYQFDLHESDVALRGGVKKVPIIPPSTAADHALSFLACNPRASKYADPMEVHLLSGCRMNVQDMFETYGLKLRSGTWASHMAKIANCSCCPGSRITSSPKYSGVHITTMTKPGQGWSYDVAYLLFRTLNHERYFLIGTDDATTIRPLWLLKNIQADTITSLIRANHIRSKVATGNYVQQVRTDNGAEYNSELFGELKNTQGFIHKHPQRNYSNKNPRAEGSNRVIPQMAVSYTLQRVVPRVFFGYALEYASYVDSLIPPKGSRVSKYEMFYGRPPPVSLASLPPFGCTMWVKKEGPKGPRSDSKAYHAVFLGRCPKTEQHLAYVPTLHKVLVTSHAWFHPSRSGWLDAKRPELRARSAGPSVPESNWPRRFFSVEDEAPATEADIQSAKNFVIDPLILEHDKSASSASLPNPDLTPSVPPSQPLPDFVDHSFYPFDDPIQSSLSPSAPVLPSWAMPSESVSSSASVSPSPRSVSPSSHSVPPSPVSASPFALLHEAKQAEQVLEDRVSQDIFVAFRQAADRVDGASFQEFADDKPSWRAFEQSEIGHPLNTVTGPRIRKPVVHFSPIAHDASLVSVVVSKREANNSGEFAAARAAHLQDLQDYDVYEPVSIDEAYSQRKHIYGITWADRRILDGKEIAKLKSRTAYHGFEARHLTKAMTTSPTPTHDEIRFFFALGVATVKRDSRGDVVSRLINFQDDVKNAFFLAKLPEPIYVYPPTGYTTDPKVIWKVTKALPGGRDSGRIWWRTEAMPFVKSQGFQRLPAFQCTFDRQCPETGLQEYLQLATDNFIGFFSSQKHIDQFRAAAVKAFRVFLPQPITKYLGIDIEERMVDGVREIKLYMKSHIEHVAVELGLEDRHPVAVPWVAKEEVPKVTSVLAGKFSPPTVMGLVNFATIARPDVLAAVSELGALQAKPKEFKYTAAEQIVCYLSGTKLLGIIFSENGNKRFDGDADADGNSSPDRKTRIGGCTFLSDSAVTFFSSKLKYTTPLSTCENEIMGMSKQSKAMRAVHNYVRYSRNSPFAVVGPFKMRNDNDAAILAVNEFIFSKGLKHIDLRYMHLNEDVESGFLIVERVSSEKNRSDMLTKPLKRIVFLRNRPYLVRE